MTTYTYLKKGRMRERPFHLLNESETASLCGRVQVGEAGAQMLAYAPGPVSEGLLCEACRQRAAVAAVQRVAEGSPFRVGNGSFRVGNG